MNRILALATALLMVGGTLLAQETKEAPAAQVVTFKARAYKKGDKIAFSGQMNMNMDMTISVMDQEQEQKQSNKETFAVALEVLAVDKKGVVTKAKGKVTKWEKTDKMSAPMMGETETGLSDAQTSLIGKEFLLDASTSPASFTDTEGKALPSDQAAALKEELLDDAGRIEALDNEDVNSMIPDKVRVGETVKLTGAQIAKLVGADGEEAEELGDPADSFSGGLKLKEVRTILGNKVGVFELDVKMEADVQGMAQIKAKPEGELLIGCDDKYLYKLDVDGKMSMNGSQAMPGPDGEEIEIVMSGEGVIAVAIQALYAKVK